MKEMNLIELETINGGDTASCLGYTGAALGGAAGAVGGFAAGGPVGAVVGVLSGASAGAFAGAAGNSCPSISSTPSEILGGGTDFQAGTMMGGFNMPKM